MISDDAVEAAAKVAWAKNSDVPWVLLPAEPRAPYVEYARELLEAAAPHLGMSREEISKDLERVRAVRDSFEPGQPVWLLNSGMVIAYESVLGVTDTKDEAAK